MRASPLEQVIVAIQDILDEEDSFGYISVEDLGEVLDDLIRMKRRGMDIHGGRRGARTQTPSSRRSPPKQKRKPSAYQVAYGKAFKKVAPRFKKKDGSWRKGGFAAAGRAARREPSVRRLKKK